MGAIPADAGRPERERLCQPVARLLGRARDAVVCDRRLADRPRRAPRRLQQKPSLEAVARDRVAAARAERNGRAAQQQRLTRKQARAQTAERAA